MFFFSFLAWERKTLVFINNFSSFFFSFSLFGALVSVLYPSAIFIDQAVTDEKHKITLSRVRNRMGSTYFVFTYSIRDILDT